MLGQWGKLVREGGPLGWGCLALGSSAKPWCQDSRGVSTILPFLAEVFSFEFDTLM